MNPTACHFAKKLYVTLEILQVDLDAWVKKYKWYWLDPGAVASWENAKACLAF